MHEMHATQTYTPAHPLYINEPAMKAGGGVAKTAVKLGKNKDTV